jgi:predicted metal-dependent hydrolase
MSLLDPSGKLEVRSRPGDHVVAEIPLVDRAGDWIHEYMPLARAKNIQAEVREVPGGRVLSVQVPVGVTREQTAELLERALGLIETAQARRDEKRSSSATVEQYIRDWWDHQTRLTPA